MMFRYLLALLLFGSNGIVASRIALSGAEIVLLRAMIGSILLLGAFLLSGGRFTCRIRSRSFVFLALSGVSMGAGWVFLYQAYQLIGVSMASLTYYCGPVLVMALSPLLFGEKLTVPKWIGFCTVVCGVFLVNGRAAYSGASSWGIVCGALSAVLYAIMVICNKKAIAIQGMENAVLQLIFSFITVAVFIGVRQGFCLRIAAQDVIWILLLGVLNTGIGCYLYFSSIGRLPVQTVAVCGYLEPLCAVVLSAVILHEQMQVVQICGAAMILGGAVVTELLCAKTPVHAASAQQKRA